MSYPRLAIAIAMVAPIATHAATFVITKGGTYSGTWINTDPPVVQNTGYPVPVAPPAVRVETTEPVVLQDCTIKGKGLLIDATYSFTNITVKNCVVEGLNPDVRGVQQDRFIGTYRPHSLQVIGNTIINTAGIYVDGGTYDPQAGNQNEPLRGPLLITRNDVRNINGLVSDGLGGYLVNRPYAEVISTRPLVRNAKGELEPAWIPLVQFVQLNHVRSTHNKSMEISWNRVINKPGQSAVEDNINIVESQGMASTPLRIHNNFIQGAYPADSNKGGYSGGGIITDGNPTSSVDPHVSAYVWIYDNHIVDTVNYGIQLASGHHHAVFNNRLIGWNSVNGIIASASPPYLVHPSGNVGLSSWLYRDGEGNVLPYSLSNFHSNVYRDNLSWWSRGSREDGVLIDPANSLNNMYYLVDCEMGAGNRCDAPRPFAKVPLPSEELVRFNTKAAVGLIKIGARASWVR